MSLFNKNKVLGVPGWLIEWSMQLFFFLKIYLFTWERASTHMLVYSRGERGRGGGGERISGRLHAQCKPDVGLDLMTHEIIIWARLQIGHVAN